MTTFVWQSDAFAVSPVLIDTEEIADLLERAADQLESEKVDWCRGQLWKPWGNKYGTTKISVCAWGALMLADHDQRKHGISSAFDLVTPRVRWTATQLEKRLEGSLAAWNDREALDKGDVIDLFKETAKDLRNANQ